jgi:hypothetical protein
VLGGEQKRHRCSVGALRTMRMRARNNEQQEESNKGGKCQQFIFFKKKKPEILND